MCYSCLPERAVRRFQVVARRLPGDGRVGLGHVPPRHERAVQRARLRVDVNAALQGPDDVRACAGKAFF